MKVQVDLVAELPKFVRMVVVDEATGARHTNNVRIQYDDLPKYCKECRLQGHNDEGCRKLNPHLRNNYKDTRGKGNNEVMNDAIKLSFASNAFPPRTLMSGKVVGDPDAWAIVEGRSPANEVKGVSKGTNSPTKVKDDINKERNQTTKEGLVTSNKFESLSEKDVQVGEKQKQYQQQEEDMSNNGKQQSSSTRRWVKKLSTLMEIGETE